MNFLENINSTNYLEALYERLINSLRKTKKELIQNSVLLTINKLNSNERFKVLSDAAQRFEGVFEADLAPLLEKKYIKISEIAATNKHYVITALGIYHIEYNNSILDLNKILNHIQEDVLDFPIVNRPLNEKEQVIILAMVAMRNFDLDTLLDLNSIEVSAKWEEIVFDIIIPFLNDKKIVNSSNLLAQKTGHENPVSYMIRRLNDFPKKTKNLFTVTNKNQYYLNIDFHDIEEAESQISYLLRKIFYKLSTIEEAEEIKDFLCKTSQSQSMYVLNNFKFINYEWDKIIDNVINIMFLGIN